MRHSLCSEGSGRSRTKAQSLYIGITSNIKLGGLGETSDTTRVLTALLDAFDQLLARYRRQVVGIEKHLDTTVLQRVFRGLGEPLPKPMHES